MKKGDGMNTATIEIRPLQREDFEAVVEIDERVFKHARPEYYEMKFAPALDKKDRLVTSLVAEEDGKVVGFVMSELFVGEYGIPETTATLNTIGIHPDYHRKGIGKQLMEEFIGHLRKAGVEKLNTLVDWDDWQLIRFFSANGFVPAKTINLELNLD
jgi:ribosomal protein S18 acetylase RimI-like enzyme